MAVHVLGNGPSLTHTFNRQSWPNTDVFIGCNFSDETLRPDYTMFIDVRPLRLFAENGYRLHIPTILSDKAYEYITNELSHRFSWDYINLREVFPLIHWTDVSKSIAMNSGHHAAMYAILNEPDHSTIHIWGMDSLWTDDLASLTDVYTRPTVESRTEGQRAMVWRQYWSEIFLRNCDHQFIIHHPQGHSILLDLSKLKNALTQQAL